MHALRRGFSRMLQVLGRKEILSLCLMILTADVVMGIIAPSFSLYATGIGASLALIGALSAVEGLTRILSSVPVGLLSDVKGRKAVLSGGMLLFALAAFSISVIQNPYGLLPVRAVIGLAMICSFFVGIAYIGDVVPLEDRGLVIGLYATFMGSGFAIGSAIGGHAAAGYGYATTYRIAAGVALLGFLVARWGLRPGTNARPAGEARGAQRNRFRLVLRNPNILAASVANLANNAWYSGLIASFFALYANSIGIGQAAIGTMFALRAIMSTAARLPTGLLTTRFDSRKLMIAALTLAMVAIVAITASTSASILTLLLMAEGVAYGMFLTSGQAFVTEHADDASRGTAVGIYSTAGGIGSTGGPFALGLIAEAWGLVAVFWAIGVMVFLGILTVAGIGLLNGHTVASARSEVEA
jgi:MFS family permease